MSFAGFSEDDLIRIKSSENTVNDQLNIPIVKKLDKLGVRTKRQGNQYKLPTLQTQMLDEAIDNLNFEKCKLSLKSPTSPDRIEKAVDSEEDNSIADNLVNINENTDLDMTSVEGECHISDYDSIHDLRKCSTGSTPDIVRGVSNYSEDELAAHKVKLGELQLKQKIMEEQNKKRKEMLSKALADRTKQTEEEVIRLEKIKRELQVLDGQFSQDVAVLRKKIDQACLSYTEAEKHYLKVEKDFLQAKICLQKEKERKELLTEHLCALITHNETRKAQKLETLMLELATDKKNEVNDVTKSIEDEEPIIVDGVDQKTGKIVEMSIESR